MFKNAITKKMPWMLLLGGLVCFAETDDRVQVHGYADIHSNNTLDGGPRKFDVHRAVIGIHAGLTDRISYAMEVDFEHSFKEPELEFAQVDFVVNPMLTIRAGDMLLPVGPLNEFHEPPLFLSVERPYIEKDVIPTSWQEIGAGVLLSLFDSRLGVRSYVVNGLNGKELGNGTAGIRKARTKGIEPQSRDMASVSRAEFSPVLPLKIGASFYMGGADHSYDEADQISVTMSEVDAKYKLRGLVTKLQAAYGTIGGTHFPEEHAFVGFMGEAGYHFYGHLGDETEIAPFARIEYIDLDQKNDATQSAYRTSTAGVAVFFSPKIAVKGDVVKWNYEDETKNKTDVNLGIGLMF